MNTNPDHKHLEQPMFFGEDTGVARYEEQKHRVFETLTEKQLSFFWRPEEVDLSIDRMQYAKMPEHEKSFSIRTCNIKPCWIPFRGAALTWLSSLSLPMSRWKRGSKHGRSVKQSIAAVIRTFSATYTSTRQKSSIKFCATKRS